MSNVYVYEQGAVLKYKESVIYVYDEINKIANEILETEK